MIVNQSVRRAVRHALAIGAVAAIGAGYLTANAAQPGAIPTTAAGTTQIRTVTAKADAKRSIVLAQATTPQTTRGASAVVPALQTVVVTGSLISRTSIETPNPIQIISAKDLLQSGYTDISSVLRNITANGASTLGQSFSFAFAAGGSGVSLRGLTVGDTLVLIDGERTVPYPLLDDNQRSFVDVSSIPFMAVQQVQVDKNGASAVYGSDAIAGVVNILLKKEYQGFKVSAESGTSQKWDGTMEHFGFIGGHGSLTSDGYNWYVSGEFRHQDQILASSRQGLWTNTNWTPWGGFNDSGFTDNGSPQNPFFTYPGSMTGYLLDPATIATNGGLNPATGSYAFLPGCDPVSFATSKCELNEPQAQLQPPTTRVNVLGKFTKQLAGDWRFVLQASWFNSRAEEIGNFSSPVGNRTAYPPGLVNIAFGPGVSPHLVPATPAVFTVPADYPGNPYGVPAPLIYSFPEIGPAETHTDTNTYRALVSLDGTAGGWKLHATAGAMYAKMQYKLYGQLAWQQLQNALNGGYILGSSGGASLFAPVMESTPWSELDLVDVHGQHTLFDMPGGPLELAIGAQWYKKVQDEHAPPTAESGAQVEAGGPIYIIGTEKDTAVFAELDGKPIRPLEIDAAVRYDSYQTFGSATTPQIGVKFTPFHMLVLRGTYGKGFRAPSAAEGVASGELFGAGAFTDPVLCPNPSPGGGLTGPGDFPSQCNFGFTGLQLANPHLKDVESTNWTAGVVFQPVEQASVSVDYYNIKIRNDIISAFEAGGPSDFTSLIRGPQEYLPYCPATMTGGCSSSQFVTSLTPVGTILAAEFPYVNAGATDTSGFDVDLQTHFNLGRFGRVTAEATWTHLLTYQLIVGGTTFELAGTHGPSGISGDTGNPRDRANLNFSWSKGAVTVVPSLMYVGHFSITDPSAGLGTCSEAMAFDGRFPGITPQTGTSMCNVGYFLETNLYGSYQMTGALQIHASVTNLFNKAPPLDIQTYGAGSLFYPYDAAFEQDGAVGRYFTVGFTYDFD